MSFAVIAIIILMMLGFAQIDSIEKQKIESENHNYCENHKVLKTSTKFSKALKNNTQYLVEFEDGKIIEVSEEDFPKYIVGQNCK